MKSLRALILFPLFFIAIRPAPGQQSAPSAPPASATASVWNALAQPAIDPGHSAPVKDLVLQRDRLKLTLSEGTLQFLQPVNGVVFGAAFRGKGRIEVAPTDPREIQQLRLFTKQDTLSQEFNEATFSFTDSTFDEIASKVQWQGGGDASLLELYVDRQRQREDSSAEILPRLFKGVLSADRKRTAYFAADLKTSAYGWLHSRFDALNPEEILVGRWRSAGPGIVVETWLSFPSGSRSTASAWDDPTAKDDFTIKSYKIDATATSGAELLATTRVNLQHKAAGERVLHFALDSNLRVDSVRDGEGHSLEFYQPRESKDRTLPYGYYVDVVLPQPTQVGQAQSIDFHYAGKRVIRKVGTGAYFAQSYGWYPTLPESFATRSDFEINFRSPMRYELVATGNKISETTDGDWRITTWKSDLPLAVAGFAFGDFLVQTEKAGNTEIQIYANRQPDDDIKAILQFAEGKLPGQGTSTSSQGGLLETGRASLPALGNMSPSAMAKTMATELGNTVRVFEAFFGPYPYKTLALTNIPYPYGQGWPGLIYLSSLSFMDSTQRNAFNIRDNVELTDFFRAHESSHQWWGHRVGWKSYHDQWLSEGFAEFSGTLYIQIRGRQKDYMERIRKDRQNLMQAGDLKSRRIESVGPIWMGRRLATQDAPRAYSFLVYTKGGYVLHMLRMMLNDPRNTQNTDQRFQAMMQDFTKTFDNKAASTEDFKAIVEKHMTPAMDAQHNHTMDWLFNQYVYGTGIPQYDFRYQVQDAGGGKWKVSGKVTRTGVPDNWVDILPIYVHQPNRVFRLGFLTTDKSTTTFELPLLNFKPYKLSLNLNEDILAEIKQ